MRRVRSIFLSDVHLGTHGCQADRLVDFLREHESSMLYLVGDIVDLWAMQSRVTWPVTHNTVVQKVLKRARHGTDVVFIPGNHDHPLREHVDLSFGNVRIAREAVHQTLDGRRLLVMHGDDFDPVARYPRLQAMLGDHGYDFMMWTQRRISALRRRLGRESHFSLAAFVRQHLASARRFVEDFEQAAVRHAQAQGFDGIICGHIHHAAARDIDGLAYLNCGDWIDSCTALVEHLDGRFELVQQRAARLCPQLVVSNG